ncbi:unnamed protein product [Tilletia controversa]|nr:unnamed protein product [Tilletia controversa]CAD6915279.1 unnamed protein product [Tilletia controversa]CAD6940532.1 unnamed protein product [Tilletia controversa]CAD6963966.1 unnamed protein product [Tilletia controversa]
MQHHSHTRCPPSTSSSMDPFRPVSVSLRTPADGRASREADIISAYSHSIDTHSIGSGTRTIHAHQPQSRPRPPRPDEVPITASSSSPLPRPRTRLRSRQQPLSTLLPSFIFTFLLLLLCNTRSTNAEDPGLFGPDQLFTSSVAYCSPPEAILVSSLGLRFFRENGTLEFDIAAASVNNNVSARAAVSVNAYGLGIFNVNLDLCTIANGILCPLPTYNFNGGGVFPVPPQFASKIPTIAFKIPDLEAVATVQLIDQNDRIVACLQATLSNGHTTYQKAAIWGTVGLALLAAGSSFLHSAIPASVGAAQWRIVDVMVAIQHVAVVSLLSLTYPVAFTSYASNFAWSIGMINIAPVQSSITSTRRKTGGLQVGTFGNALEADGGRKYDPFLPRRSLVEWTPESFTMAERSSFHPQSLLKRISEDDPASLLREIHFDEHAVVTPLNKTFLGSLPGRLLAVERIYAPNTGPNGQLLQASEGGPLPLIDPNRTTEEGIDLFAERLDIEPANVFLTVLINYVILFGFMLAALTAIYVLVRFFSKILAPPNWAQRLVKWDQFGGSYVTAFIGRYLLITFPILLLFAFYQWRFGDSWVPDLLAAIAIAVFLAGLATFFIPMFVHARRSGKEELYYPEDLPPAEAGRVPKVWGSFAHPWKPKFYWAYLLFLLWSVIRACFIAFGTHHGFRQSVGLLAFELVLFLILCIFRPSRNGAGNCVTILLCLSRVISWGICVAFTHEANVKTIPRVVVGFVLVVATGIPIILLLLLTIVDLFSPLRPRKLRTIKRMNRKRAEREAKAVEEKEKEKESTAEPASPASS